MLNDLWVVRQLQVHPEWRDPLLFVTDLNVNWGRPRMEGNWAYAYLTFVSSSLPDVEPWWARTNDATWQVFGFASRPSYQTTRERFVELEGVADEFQQITSMLVQHARKHTNGLVGQDIHVDGTEAETNARLVHDCQPGEGCCRKGGGRRRRGRLLPDRISAKDARATRHSLSEDAPEDAIEFDLGAASEFVIHPGQKATARVKVGSCWYRTLDVTAGIRAYVRPSGTVKAFWHGFYNHKAVDHYTGAPVAILITSSSVQEHHAYPELLEQVKTTIGGTPRAVIGDRGFSVRSVFELNTREGIASVFPWRKPHQSITREDERTDRYDEHGIPRCPHCGGPTEYHRFQGGASPRVWFRCQAPATEDCKKIGSIACSNNWRLLLPLWRTEEAYIALRDTHQEYERVHTLWRSRYKVGGDNHQTRPKRIGVGCQQLRANAALLIEWLRILSREGWMGSARRNTSDRIKHTAKQATASLRRARAKRGLHLPYRPAAVALGLGGLIPGESPPDPHPPDADEAPF